MFRLTQSYPFANLLPSFEGDLYFDESPGHTAQRILYATDASVYQEMPIAVALPKTVADIKRLLRFAQQHKLGLIPRAAGTSLAGQVVGSGIVVDISKYFGQIGELNVAEQWVRVQPGVIRDDLNAFLKPHGLLFGPETSTASRAMIGGMIGNNSCGLHSIVWGTTRDHLVEVQAVLSDGAEVTFGPLTQAQFDAKCRGENVVSLLEQRLYVQFRDWLSNPTIQQQIRDGYPKPTVTRRNTGYALDAFLSFWEQGKEKKGTSPSSSPSFSLSPFSLVPEKTFNFSPLIAGSEGTLCFITGAKLNLLPLPPKETALVCAHFETIRQSLEANLVALEHQCYASELVDDYILQLTKTNIEQTKNRTFVEGDPKAILMVEFFDNTAESVRQRAERFVTDLQTKGLGYAYPVLFDEETKKPWALRKAGLSIMYNIPGDDKPANVIEDTAVDVHDLPDYIDELDKMAWEQHGLKLEYSAHAGAGEIHVLPLINLKSSEGRTKFRNLLMDTAQLVKKYGGSLSGEHGDGRLRGECIAFMLGGENYQLCKDVKALWDPHNTFNPGKVVDTPPMNESLRSEADTVIPQPKTIFDFSKDGGLLELAEKCSGSGDCRKTEISGGTMCPSYMATRREHDTTRARANILRHFYSSQDKPSKHDYAAVKDVLDLCLSCKACKSECPSSVDMTRMKAEFTQQQYRESGIPLRARLVGNFTRLMSLASIAPWAYNAIYDTPVLRRIANQAVGFHPNRTMPGLGKETLRKWAKGAGRGAEGLKVMGEGQGVEASNPAQPQALPRTPYTPGPTPHALYLFVDEFTNFNDVEVGQKAIQLLERLGYSVLLPEHAESGRTYLSKGLVEEARKLAIRNVTALKDLITEEAPLIGLEPSAILTFRDEYPDLVPAELKAAAQHIARNTFLFEEWLAREVDANRIDRSRFTTDTRLVKVHGHCHQKALSSMVPVKKVLSLPRNYDVQLIPSGCCGMAGSFGYETEHYDLSMQIGELVLFPAIRSTTDDVIISAAGTSCRHQIKDGTRRHAQHPAEILFDALI
ncbi:FAD-binding and (Fe-S)-binding domain-containing protein [Spirosoma sp. KUDC1026]|uniref:FAD-binding and (Fe-S)-binding domain-containing protein n=1 Tax=Spirosoma sp. KUDC1026 TaxID=2745947 RepID=UPI00159BB738|nr:FAD-binding and (Fe-S)-binding domain-containing protein [Spirosoma sp. KUDC1026]QKZ12799.1 FAD-binding protein [Spirosoma sp. KUDC1026]